MQERLGQQGCFSFVHDFPAVNNAGTTYTVSVSYNGTNAVSVSATSITLGGSNYAMCTTIQYSNKPCSNSTVLTVDPQSTQATIPTKSSQEMQQEAEQSGALTIWHEFSWWYPWYRCHLRINCTLPQGQLCMDYGWTFLPFGQTFECNEVAALVLNEIASDVLWDLVTGYVIAKLVLHGAALLLGKTLVGAAVAIGTYAFVCGFETWQLYDNSGNDPCTWLAGFIASAISGTFGLLEAKLHSLVQFLTAAGRRMLQEIHHIMNSFWARGLDFFEITGIAFALIDFAFMALYLVQFVTMI